MRSAFADLYYNDKASLLNFTGTISFETLDADDEYPCDEDPDPDVPVPVEGGSGNPGSGGSGGGSSSGGVRGGDYGYTYSQELVNAQFLAMTIAAAVHQLDQGEENENPEGEEHYHNVFFKTAQIDGSDAGFSADDPCDDSEEVGILGPPDPDPCVTLAAIADNLVISTSLNTLRGNLNQNRERLFTFSYNGSGQLFPRPELNNSGNTATLVSTVATFGVAHTHQNGSGNDSGLYKMFSFKDIIKVYEFASNYATSGIPTAPLFFNIMVIDGYDYIVFPNNLTEFKNINIFDNPEDVEILDRKLKDIYEKLGTSTQITHQTLARYFLMFMNNKSDDSKLLSGTDFNLSLFRKKNNSNTPQAWEKLELDPDDNYQLKEPVPCN